MTRLTEVEGGGIYIYIYPGPEGPPGSMPHPPPPLTTYLIQNLLTPFTSKFGLHREFVGMCGVRGGGVQDHVRRIGHNDYRPLSVNRQRPHTATWPPLWQQDRSPFLLLGQRVVKHTAADDRADAKPDSSDARGSHVPREEALP